MEVNEQIAIDHGLKKDEYKKICDLLKRTPNLTELGIFSAMWNEHCSYKSSRLHLKKLPTTGKKVIQGPGEKKLTGFFMGQIMKATKGTADPKMTATLINQLIVNQ